MTTLALATLALASLMCGGASTDEDTAAPVGGVAGEAGGAGGAAEEGGHTSAAGTGSGSGGTAGDAGACAGPGPKPIDGVPKCDQYQGFYFCASTNCQSGASCCVASDCEAPPPRCESGTCDSHGGTRAVNFGKPQCWSGRCVFEREMYACTWDACSGCSLGAKVATCVASAAGAPYCADNWCQYKSCGTPCGAAYGMCDGKGVCVKASPWPNCAGMAGSGGTGGASGTSGAGTGGASGTSSAGTGGASGTSSAGSASSAGSSG